MSLPEPVPGLVIGYSYLWHREYIKGEEQGRKDRPCAIVAAVENLEGETLVTVLPITHTMPKKPESAVEIPAKVKAHLGLDGERSWIICDEYNKFIWPGPDLRAVPKKKPQSFSFGFLSRGLFKAVKTKVLTQARGHSLKVVSRSD
jgi:hypothetical protein